MSSVAASALCQGYAQMATLREYRPSDEQSLVELSLRAWEPVFDALEQALGRELFLRLRGDWRAGQARQVRDALADTGQQRVWVAEDLGPRTIGFVAARLDPEHELGEIYMIAVDPDAQRQGVGTALTTVATDWLRHAGMRVAMIETGGDRGHGPARRLYEKAGYTPLAAVRFFKSL